MNKTVLLVNEWAAYEAQHPEASLDEFCRHYLLRKKEGEEQQLSGAQGHQPPTPHLALLKLMGVIMRLHGIYNALAIKNVEIRRDEDFYFLNHIKHAKNPRKTEIIHAFMLELTTGLSILAGLKDNGLIDEVDDLEDKRSKRVSITPKGEAVLLDCYRQFGKVGALLFKDVPVEDAQLCVQLLQRVVQRYMPLAQQHRNRDFEEVFVETMGEEYAFCPDKKAP